MKNIPQDLRNWLIRGKKILSSVDEISEEFQKEVSNLLQELLARQSTISPRLYLIVNQGVHPIVEDLKKQFGKNIEYEIITEGNINLTSEAEIVQRVKEIVYKNRTKNYVLVPSGMPYLITMVYNTLWQMTSRHPIYLQYDRETGQYKEKILDPRKFL